MMNWRNGWNEAMWRARQYATADLTRRYHYRVIGVRQPDGWLYHVVAVPRG